VSKKDLRCRYCGHEMAFHESNWNRDRRRCPQCNDPNLQEIKESRSIDTYGKEYNESLAEWKAKNIKKVEDKKKEEDEKDAMSQHNLWGYD
jgi:phage FluMu protein Com